MIELPMTLFESEIRKLNLPGFIIDDIIAIRNICMEAGEQPAPQQQAQQQAPQQAAQTQPQQPVQQQAQPNAQQQSNQAPPQQGQQQPQQQPQQQAQPQVQNQTHQTLDASQVDTKKLAKEFTGYLNSCKENVKKALIEKFGDNGQTIMNRVLEWVKSDSPISFEEEILPFFKQKDGEPADNDTINMFRQNFQKYFGLKIANPNQETKKE